MICYAKSDYLAPCAELDTGLRGGVSHDIFSWRSRLNGTRPVPPRSHWIRLKGARLQRVAAPSAFKLVSTKEKTQRTNEDPGYKKWAVSGATREGGIVAWSRTTSKAARLSRMFGDGLSIGLQKRWRRYIVECLHTQFLQDQLDSGPGIFRVGYLSPSLECVIELVHYGELVRSSGGGSRSDTAMCIKLIYMPAVLQRCGILRAIVDWIFSIEEYGAVILDLVENRDLLKRLVEGRKWKCMVLPEGHTKNWISDVYFNTSWFLRREWRPVDRGDSLF